MHIYLSSGVIEPFQSCTTHIIEVKQQLFLSYGEVMAIEVGRKTLLHNDFR